MKPVAKELLFENGAPNAHYDVLVYDGNGSQEKNLGSLYTISYLKHGDEDLGYIMSLISSVAKREYYSKQSLIEQNPKQAFENTLRKLNEILDDFYENRDFELDLGLLAISGGSIFISHLGKFKIALARQDEYIDILNSVALFDKSSEDARKFSNVMSGKLVSGDKLVAYHPNRSVTLREKILKDIFVNESQDVFHDKIAQLASNVNTFSYCGIHIAIGEIKEIPITKNHKFSDVGQAITAASPAEQETVAVSATKQFLGDKNFSRERPKIQPPPRIIPAEVSISHKRTVLRDIGGYLADLKNIGRMGRKKKTILLAVLAVVVIIPLGIVVYMISSGSMGKASVAFKNAADKYRLAQLALSKSDFRGARDLLGAALSDVSGVRNSKTDKIANEITGTMDFVDKTTDVKPELIYEPGTSQGITVSKIIGDDNSPYAANQQGVLYVVTPGNLVQVGNFAMDAKHVIEMGKYLVAFDENKNISVFSGESQKINLITLRESPQAKVMTAYEGNLYMVTTTGKILKYANVVGDIKKSDWGVLGSENVLSMAIDGNLYLLADNGKIITMYKGKRTGEIDLQFNPSPDSKIFTPANGSTSLFVYDPVKKKVYTFDKTSKMLVSSYKIDEAAEVSDLYVNAKENILILTKDGKIWRIGT
ncbi:MAG: hypothetical protein CEN90_163 [Parcubacteria group bacterium Licking1014_17]|nr:MAG: hypothetical protein CEN90_163 [Parcubacteria group bacterium Licking1014_17]